ncbi:hypothetical protein NDU88_002154 [Pleurodeles waltl]|uniref:Uncharacterized protein n=1 Tax=Pleurodeles waltl TaxID=8319 RepID=A0AAV7RDP5_PLEWA|nr:hypothetical protein NDU88_002154 [Pleurodeles waltl]
MDPFRGGARWQSRRADAALRPRPPRLRTPRSEDASLNTGAARGRPPFDVLPAWYGRDEHAGGAPEGILRTEGRLRSPAAGFNHGN